MAKDEPKAESGKPKAGHKKIPNPGEPKPAKRKQERSHKTGYFMATPPPEFKPQAPPTES